MREIRYFITTQEDRMLFDTLVQLLERSSFDNIELEDNAYYGKEIRFEDVQEDVAYLYCVGEGYQSTTDSDTIDPGRGTAWFRRMRDEEVSDSVRAQNKWEDLISKTAKKYYATTPLLVYVDTQTNFNQRAELQKGNIENLIRTFYGYDGVRVETSPSQEMKEIYAVSMDMKVRATAGAPTPVIGKLYFTIENNNLVFLDKTDAKWIQSIMEQSCTGTARRPSVDKSYDEIKSKIDSKTCMLVMNKLGNTEHLENKILFNGANQAVIDRLTDALRGEKRHGDVEVEISEIESNMYYIISVKVTAFDIYLSNMDDPAMRATVLFNRLSLRCLRCHDNAVMMNDNAIHYEDADKKPHDIRLGYDEDEVWFEEGGHVVRRDIDEEEYEEMLSALKQYVFGRHLKQISCEACVGHKACWRYACQGNQQEVVKDADGTTEIKCADCMYPETFIRLGGVAYSPRLLYYDADTRSITYGNYDYCSFCGREIAEGKELCNLCEGLLSPDDEDKPAQRKLYRRYRGLLPLSARVFRFGSRCVEDQSRIVFMVGSNTYSFDKLNGFIEGFKAVKGSSK